MKSLLVMITLFSTSFVYANSNPQIRVCNSHNANFWSFDIVKPKKDNIGVCNFNGAMIGSISLIKYFYEGSDSKAIKAFYKTKRVKTKSCESAGAVKITGLDSNKNKTFLCLFSDYSIIKFKTLISGWFSKSNKELTRAL